MKKFLYILGGLLFLCLVALVAVPPFINWTSYKGKIQELVKAETGLDLKIEGKMKLRILPTPAFAIQNVSIKAPEKCQEKELMSLQSAELHLALLPLITKKINVESLTLVTPKINLEINDHCDYKTLFQKKEKEQKSGSVQIGAATLFGDQNANVDVSKKNMPDISISKFYIQKAEISVTENNVKHQIEHINAELSLDSLMGPYDIKGTAKLAKQEIDFKTKIGSIAAGLETPLSLVFNLGQDNLNFNGQLLGGFDNPSLKGKMSANLLSKDGYLRSFVNDLPDALKDVLKVQFDVNAQPKNGDLQNIKVSWGDFKSEGSFGFKRLENKLWDLTAALKFSPILLDKLNKEKKIAFESMSIFSNAFADDKHKPIAFKIPDTIRANLSLAFDGVSYGKQVWRDLKLNVSLDKGVVALQKFNLPIPDGKIEGDLTLKTQNNALLYNGAVKVVTGDVKAVAKLFMDTKALPKSSLNLSANFNGNLDQVKLSNVDVQTSFINFGGDALYNFADKGISAHLIMDQVDLDQALLKFTRVASLETDNDFKIIRIASKDAPKTGMSLDFLKGPKIDLELKCNGLKFKDKQFKNLTANVNLRDEALNINEVKGQIDNIGFAMRGNLQEKNNKSLLAFEIQSKGKIDKIGDIQSSMTGEGTLDQLNVKSTFFVFGASGSADLVLNPLDPLANLKGHLNINHPEAGMLFGSPDKWGPFVLNAPISSHNGQINIGHLDGSIGKNAFKGLANLDLTKAKPFVQLALDFNAIQLSALQEENPLAKIILISQINPPMQQNSSGWSKSPLDLSGLNKVDADLSLKAAQFLYGKMPLQNVILSAKIRNGTVNVENVSALLAGGEIKGNGSIQGLDSNKMKGDIQLSNIDIAILGKALGNNVPVTGKINGQMNIGGYGRSLYDVMASLNGQGNFNVLQAILQGYDLNAIAQKAQHLKKLNDFMDLFGSTKSGGQTPFEQVQGRFQITNGVMTTNDTQVKCQAGLGQVQGNVDIVNKFLNLNVNFKLAGEKNFPPIAASLTGTWDNPKTRLDSREIESYLLQRGVESLGQKLLENKRNKNNQGEASADGEKPKKKRILDDLLGEVLGGHKAEKEAPVAENNGADNNVPPPAVQDNQPAQEDEQPKKRRHGKDVLNGLLQGLLQ
ncbi:MAG: AsmA family protein [Alphaproteobacteria bacterium]|nr:AsmA family protein [Alphaproteobacteria bacterium]